MTFALLVIASLVTATISAILGMGGGLTLMAIFSVLLPVHVIVPLHGVVQLASNASRTIAFRTHIYRPVVWVFAPSTLIGALIARGLWNGDKLTWVRAAIGGVIIVFLVSRRLGRTVKTIPLPVYGIVGLGVGLASIFVGATGPLLAPFFLRADFDKEQIVASKAMCQLWVHAIKLPVFLSLGFDYEPHLPLLAALIPAVVAGTWIGKNLLKRLAERTFLQLFESLLLIVAIYLLWVGTHAIIQGDVKPFA